MIRRISISNYALIRDLTLQPAEGFNIITGETGAGKSIILGALSMLQGKRVDSKSVILSDEKSSVEIEATLPDGTARTLRREIMPNGRSRAFIDGQPVTLAELAEVSAPLIDIHSQHQNQQLSDPAFQLEVIDRIAKNDELLAEYKTAFADYRSALLTFVRTRDEIERTRNDADYLEYQLSEFNGLDINEAEDDELEAMRDSLANSAEITRSLSTASRLMAFDDNTAVDILNNALDSLREAASLSDSYTKQVEQLVNIVLEIESLADYIHDEARTIDVDPVSLEELEKRLSRIKQLKSKHKVETIGQLIAVRDTIAGRLEALQNCETTLHDLEQTARKLKKRALEIASTISDRRRAAAAEFASMLTERARPLGMENLKVEVKVDTGKLNPDGIDTVEFLFAFNKNQAPAPVNNRASGGEISRVMLALKSITVEHRHTPTIIFDEIDTGVSGDVANRMARLMDIIANHIQVITITHLPQVAARGAKHFKVYKRDDDTSTRTYINELTHEQRREELALMLSGNPADSSALATADSLLAGSDKQ